MRKVFLLGVLAAAQPALAQGHVPEPIKQRVNDLVAACAQAGGKLGSMDGQGRFVIPVELTGDGRTDFVVSEANFPCTGRPNLFRPDGLGRVQVYAADASGGARLLFDERLLAYRLVAGKPARLQIARRGAACGQGAAANARCGDELRWNASAARFDQVATDGRPAAPRAIAAPEAAAPIPAAAPAGATPAAPAGPVPPVVAGAEGRFKAACRSRFLATKPPRTDWIDEACAEEWQKVVSTQPVAEALLRAIPAGPGAAPALADLRQRMAGVRWLAKPVQDTLATGVLGDYSISISGKGRPDSVNVNWSKVGAEIPLDLPEAFAARGATLKLTRCEKMGTGEGERNWTVTFPGRQPFALEIFQRTAPTGGAWSNYAATVRLDGAPSTRGPTNCERFF
ncbi:hypothetical protein L6Q21_17065 [Sandaracinobacter sp. RS1-74]|uniref:hypothetical protein n=1 Tax=Sandaracinobacteroides sayramensis TaxID=2913411 RepID=UPI001EDAFD6B|nr:hypothetical protein [Sandaracinobacteroides sayramensis]MCG2842688.1 hypothetical protein [Sandaracinobacteroides sayramensis]